jgi:hypothetical protein
MWKNIVDQENTQMTKRRMRIACCIPTATNIQSECAILIAFPLRQWMHDSAPMLRYTYIGCLVNICVLAVGQSVLQEFFQNLKNSYPQKVILNWHMPGDQIHQSIIWHFLQHEDNSMRCCCLTILFVDSVLHSVTLQTQELLTVVSFSVFLHHFCNTNPSARRQYSNMCGRLYHIVHADTS